MKKVIDFIGIGAPKSGSTWLSTCLEEHPQILFSSKKSRKELHFFNVDNVWGDNSTGRMSYYDRGLDWYYNQFPEPLEGHKIGEFSVTYMADPVAFARIKKDFPDTKIIAILRNPIDMIYSLHWYFYNGAVIDIPKSFEKNIDNGMFLDKGFYYKHLKNFYYNFPKDHILTLLYDDIKKDKKAVLHQVYKFIGVDDTFVPASMESSVNAAFTIRNSLFKKLVHIMLKTLDIAKLEHIRIKIFESQRLQDIYTLLNKKPSKYPSMSAETRKRCLEIYLDDITNLEKLLERDLSAWKKC